jgi:hypothetical protein
MIFTALWNRGRVVKEQTGKPMPLPRQAETGPKGSINGVRQMGVSDATSEWH